MKSNEEVRNALEGHQIVRRVLRASPEKLKQKAHELGWSEEYLRGYQDGVEFAYDWFLSAVKL